MKLSEAKDGVCVRVAPATMGYEADHPRGFYYFPCIVTNYPGRDSPCANGLVYVMGPGGVVDDVDPSRLTVVDNAEITNKDIAAALMWLMS